MKLPVKKLALKAAKWLWKEIQEEIDNEVEARVARRTSGAPPVGSVGRGTGEGGPPFAGSP